MANHLGYVKSKRSDSSHYQNYYKSQLTNGSFGGLNIDVPQKRKSTYEPKVVKVRKKDISDIDLKVIFVYAEDITTD